MMSPGVLMWVATVLIDACGSSNREFTAVSSAAGSSNGSSPCTFTKMSPSTWAATSATRSVPVRRSGRVILASPPNSCTAFTIRSSSVATITWSTRFESMARSNSRWIIGFPASNTSGFPGSLVEPYRAGMTTTTLAELISSRSPCTGNNGPSGSVLPNQEGSGAAMLPHAARSGRRMQLFDTAQQGIELVFGMPSDRIPVSASRAVVPVGRDVEGAVKRELTGFRVLNLSSRILLLVCLFVLQGALRSAAQSTSDENKPRDETKREEVKKDDVRRDTPGVPVKPRQLIRLDVDLALLNVTVTDPYNRLVTGLEPDNFRVFEDNVEQEVVTFSAEDVPISIGVIFDFSGSMSNKVGKAREAAVQFFKTANPQDEFFLVSFNERAELTSSFTNSVEDLQSRMMLTAPKGRTALLDAIYLGLSQMRGAHNANRALLILSDGGDNHSRYNESDIKRLVKEADTQLYAIGIFDPLGYRNRTPEELGGPSLLSEVTEMTGGRVFAVEKLDELPDIASKIGMELRNQYVLGYRPSNKAHDARWRKLKIKLRAPKGLPPLSVYSKTGYYAPSH